MANLCPDEVLYQSRVGSANTTLPETLLPGETYSIAFSEAQPQDPTANHTLSFDAWPAYNSDKKMRSVRRGLLAPRQSDLSEDLDFGFKFLIWDVTVTEQGVAFSFEDQATDPFPEWGWTWKLVSGDEACTPCTALGCAAEGCSVQEDLVMVFCGDVDEDTIEPILPTSSLDLPASIPAPTSSPTGISSISIPLGSATPVAPSATRTYPQYITTATSATASIIAGSLFPGPSGSGAVLPSGGGYHYQPSPLPSAFTGAASKLQEGYIGAFALAAGLMMF